MSAAAPPGRVTLLVSSAGRRVELIECFRSGAVALGVDLTVIASDAVPAASSACHLADTTIAVPRCDDPAFVDALLEACVASGVDVVVPTIDPELLLLAAAADRFAEAGVHVVVSTHETVVVARDKARTAAVLGRALPVPATFSLDDDVDWASVEFPVVVKPVDGYASTGVTIVDRPEGLPTDGRGLVAQRLLDGVEHTINAYVSRGGDLVAVVPHRRIEVRGGEVSKAQVARRPALLAAAATVVELLPGLRGPFCFQAFLDGDRIAGVFEVNARFGGGYPLAHAAGAPFAEWILREHLGLPLPERVTVQDGLTMLRYDQSVFVAP